jgi:hypothetical protein
MKASSLGIKPQEQEQNELTLLNEAERERVRTLQRLITERATGPWKKTGRSGKETRDNREKCAETGKSVKRRG